MNVLSICNHNNLIGIGIFSENKYTIWKEFYDDFSLSDSIKVIQSSMPTTIVASLSQELMTTLKGKCEQKIKSRIVRQTNARICSLTRLENTALRLLSTFLIHGPIVNVDSRSVKGYVGEYPIIIKQISGFYTCHNHLPLIIQFNQLKRLLRNTITRFGKYTMIRWISNPLTDIKEIICRREQVSCVSFMIPKLKKLLKVCKFPSLERRVDFFKMKKALKAALTIQKILDGHFHLKDQRKFLKIYKIFSIFGNDGILDKKDAVLDALRNKYRSLPKIIEKSASTLAKKYGTSLSVIYFPTLGFFIECDHPLTTPSFAINGKFYTKTSEMIEMDNRHGDVYCETNIREAYIMSRVLKRLVSINFAELYDFLGTIDALISLYLSCNGHYAKLDSDQQTLIISDCKFGSKTVVNGCLDIGSVVESVILNQIGGKIDLNVKDIPLFEHLSAKTKHSNTECDQHSTFQKEIIELGEIFRHSSRSGICLIEGIGESTSPREGQILLCAFLENIQCKTTIVSTSFPLGHLKMYLTLDTIHLIYDEPSSTRQIEEEFAEYLKTMYD